MLAGGSHQYAMRASPLDRLLADDGAGAGGLFPTRPARAVGPFQPKHGGGLGRAPEAVWRKNVEDVSRSRGSRKAMCFIELASTWDKGSAYVRQKILEDFVESNRWKSGVELEKELGNGGSLLLTRFTAWFRLTYLKAKNLALQFRAISIFISASSGHRFLTEFIEIGGVLTVLEALNMPKVREADKTEALKLLLHIVNAGRKYKEFIGESYGIRAVIDCLARSKSDVTQDYAGAVLHALGSDNLRFQQTVYKALMATLTSTSVADANSQKVAGEVVRKVLPSIASIHPSVVDATISLLKSPHTAIQYEGCELLKDLVKRDGLKDLILSGLIDQLKIRPPEPEQKSMGATVAAAGSPEQATPARASVHTMHAAKLLGHMAATSPQLAKRMISLQCVHALLVPIGDVDSPESQRCATNTLAFLAETFPDVAKALQQHMGPNFYHVFETKPDTFFKDMTQDQIRYLQHNTVFMREVEGEGTFFDSGGVPDEEAKEPGEEMETRDDGQTKEETDEVLQRLMDAKAGKMNIPAQEQEPAGATTVADLYKPMAVVAAARSLAGNSFQRLMDRNKEEELEEELAEAKQEIHKSTLVETAAPSTGPASSKEQQEQKPKIPGLFSTSRKKRFEPRLNPKASPRYQRAAQRKTFAGAPPSGSAPFEDESAPNDEGEVTDGDGQEST